jgi:hypothetical protein
MKKSSSETYLDHTFGSFLKSLLWYKDFLNKIANTKNKILNQKEKKEILEGVVVKITAIWEVLAEDLLTDCLTFDTTKYAKTKGSTYPKHPKRSLCQGLITGHGYFNFKTTEDLKFKARGILVEKYNPFNKITRAMCKKIDEFYTLRQYIAHHSKTSKQKLLKMYKNKYQLKRFSEPGYFLLFRDQKTNQNRFVNYINIFFEISDDMAVFLKV